MAYIEWNPKIKSTWCIKNPKYKHVNMNNYVYKINVHG